MRWYSLEVAFLDFKGKGQLILGFKRRSKGGKFVRKTAERPDVTFFIVLLFIYLLWTHVVGCAYVGLRVYWTLVQYTCKPEVTELRILGGVQKDVAWLQITMHNPLRAFLLDSLLRLWLLSSVNGGSLGAPMAEVESRDDLGEYFPDELFRNMLFAPYAALNNLL